jgi:hypothetical protein
VTPAAAIYLLLPFTCRFSFGMLQHNHERNFEAFCSSLVDGIHTIIVDNTNIRRQYYKQYQDEAEQQGYEVKVEVVGEFTCNAAALYADRNMHGVPYDKIMQMLEQWWEEEDEESGGYSDGYYSEDEFDSEDGYGNCY